MVWNGEEAPILRVRGLTRTFPGVRALDRVDLDLRAGEVHVLFGENGAGKSTLIATLAGVHAPDEGSIELRGEEVHLHSVHDAREHGISAVFQEFSLVEELSIEENLFLGNELKRGPFLDRKAARRRARELLESLEFPLRPERKVKTLTRAEKQMVEIAKGFRSRVSVLILDEPTASLTERETDSLFALVRKLQAKGAGILYITHRMAEIREIGDRVTVLRDGRKIETVDAGSTAEEELVRLMTGRVIDQIFPSIEFSPGEEVLRVEGLTTRSGHVRDASLEVRAGEIVGLAGLVGSGKSELLRACYGLDGIASGRVVFLGEEVNGQSPRRMIRRGFFYGPPDRRAEGLLMNRSVRENILLPAIGTAAYRRGGFLRTGRERDTAAELAARLQLQPPRIERPVSQFSGGNQQKVLLAKSLTRDFRLFVFDEPTVGVDVGTRTEIYRFLAELCEAGAAVVVISSDLPEVLHLSRRAYVLYRGEIKAHLVGGEITQENVLQHFFEREVA